MVIIDTVDRQMIIIEHQQRGIHAVEREIDEASTIEMLDRAAPGSI